MEVKVRGMVCFINVRRGRAMYVLIMGGAGGCDCGAVVVVGIGR